MIENPTGAALASIDLPGRASTIRTDFEEPKLGYPALFALGLVAGDLVTRVAAAQKG